MHPARSWLNTTRRSSGMSPHHHLLSQAPHPAPPLYPSLSARERRRLGVVCRRPRGCALGAYLRQQSTALPCCAPCQCVQRQGDILLSRCVCVCVCMNSSHVLPLLKCVQRQGDILLSRCVCVCMNSSHVLPLLRIVIVNSCHSTLPCQNTFMTSSSVAMTCHSHGYNVGEEGEERIFLA